jgi:hypothetical protein
LKRSRCSGHHPPLKPHRQKYSVALWFVYLRRAGIVPTPTFVEPAVEAPMLALQMAWRRFPDFGVIWKDVLRSCPYDASSFSDATPG